MVRGGGTQCTFSELSPPPSLLRSLPSPPLPLLHYLTLHFPTYPSSSPPVSFPSSLTFSIHYPAFTYTYPFFSLLVSSLYPLLPFLYLTLNFPIYPFSSPPVSSLSFLTFPLPTLHLPTLTPPPLLWHLPYTFPSLIHMYCIVYPPASPLPPQPLYPLLSLFSKHVQHVLPSPHMSKLNLFCLYILYIFSADYE